MRHATPGPGSSRRVDGRAILDDGGVPKVLYRFAARTDAKPLSSTAWLLASADRCSIGWNRALYTPLL